MVNTDTEKGTGDLKKKGDFFFLMHLLKSASLQSNGCNSLGSVLKSSFGAGVLCDSLGALGHRVFGKLPGQQ